MGILLDAGCACDLVLRGFSREYILDAIHVDVGYHGNSVAKYVRGIDRVKYKIEFVRENYSDEEILDVIAAYGNGLGKEAVLNRLGIAGENIIKLHVLFRELGFEKEFKEADAASRKKNMRDGAVAKFGVDNVFKLDEYQEKAKETRVEKYGAPYTLCRDSTLSEKAVETQRRHMKDPEFKESVVKKREETCLKNLGVRHSMQSKAVREKFRNTCMERYGVPNVNMLDSYKEMTSRRMKEHAAEYREKQKKTCLEKYGYEYYAQTSESRRAVSLKMRENLDEHMKKVRDGIMKRYGVPYYSQTKEWKSMMSQFMHEHKDEMNEKRRKTCLEKYGYEYYSQTPKARKAQSDYMRSHDFNLEGRRRNHSFNASSTEEKLYEILVSIFGKNDVLRQYKDERYPFACDFYIKSIDVFIELNAFFMHGYHWFDKDNQDDVEKVRFWRHKTINEHKPSYKVAIETWTVRDVQKKEYADRNHLNYVVFWKDNLSDAMEWIAKGCPKQYY